MSIKIQELESLQDLTEVKQERIVGGQGVSNEVEERLREAQQLLPDLALAGPIGAAIEVILNAEIPEDVPGLVQL